MAFRIEVLPDHAVKIYQDNESVPFLHQPCFPNGDVWESADESREWAEMFVESIEDVNALMPPFGRGAERVAKPQPTE